LRACTTCPRLPEHQSDIIRLNECQRHHGADGDRSHPHSCRYGIAADAKEGLGSPQQAGPLSPREKGSLVEQLGYLETTLESRDHYKNHPNDLLLAMFQIVFTVTILLTLAVCVPLYFPAFTVFGLIFILLALVFGVVGFVMAVQLSERNSESGRQKILKNIAEIKGKLNL
jgi:hypothetical protein